VVQISASERNEEIAEEDFSVESRRASLLYTKRTKLENDLLISNNYRLRGKRLLFKHSIYFYILCSFYIHKFNFFASFSWS